MSGVRIGILGCANIVATAIVDPIATIPDATIAHIGARDGNRARAFAEEHGVPRHSAGYDEVIADPDVDLIYNPLPNSLHAEWTIKAMRAGKAVLCEKPLTANAAEAEQVLAVARESGAILIEAFHYRYHPMVQRISALLRAGAIGNIQRFHIDFLVPEAMLPLSDIRYAYSLAGGAAMDPGCYCVDLARLVTGEEGQVVSAQAELLAPEVDFAVDVGLSYPSGAIGTFRASLREPREDLKLELTVTGNRGTLFAQNPILPQIGHRLALRIDGADTEESFDLRTTYWYQLSEVIEVLQTGREIRTSAESGLANMRAIDAIYRAAGLARRGLVQASGG